MKLKEKILVGAAAILMLTWLFPPMNRTPRRVHKTFVPHTEFNGFKFILSNDPYPDRILKVAWSKLILLNLFILGSAGTGYFVVSRNEKK